VVVVEEVEVVECLGPITLHSSPDPIYMVIVLPKVAIYIHYDELYFLNFIMLL
jgi:hypothetical protein